MIYHIRIKGELDQSWADWLGNGTCAITLLANGGTITTLTVDSPDQPALFGILDRLRDLNLELLSVTRLEGSESGTFSEPPASSL